MCFFVILQLQLLIFYVNYVIIILTIVIFLHRALHEERENCMITIVDVRPLVSETADTECALRIAPKHRWDETLNKCLCKFFGLMHMILNSTSKAASKILCKNNLCKLFRFLCRLGSNVLKTVFTILIMTIAMVVLAYYVPQLREDFSPMYQTIATLVSLLNHFFSFLNQHIS